MNLCYCCMAEVPPEAAICPKCHSPVPYHPTDPRDLHPGTVLHGRLVIGRALGHGGFGITYIAYDSYLRILRAVKEFYPARIEASRDEQQHIVFVNAQDAKLREYRDRFLYEARMMSRASMSDAKNVVRIIDQFNENNTAYIVMEYLDGCTLDEYLKAQREPLPWQEAVPVALTVLGTLSTLHQNDLMHRDLSLNNIFRLNSGEIRLIDFGSAGLISDQSELPPSAKKGYSPLEQINSKEQGPWTDIYAMGACVFKMVVGGLPKGNPGEPMPSASRAAPSRNIPAWLDAAIIKATQREPANRFQTAEDFAKALSEGMNTRAQKKRGSKPIVPLLLVGVAAGVVVTVLLVGRPSGQQEAAPTAFVQQTATPLPSGELPLVQATATADPLTWVSNKTFRTNTTEADAGDELRLMQQALHTLHYLRAEEITGDCDSASIRAVACFCLDQNVDFNGADITPAIRQAIACAAAGADRPANVPQLTDRSMLAYMVYEKIELTVSDVPDAQGNVAVQFRFTPSRAVVVTLNGAELQNVSDNSGVGEAALNIPAEKLIDGGNVIRVAYADATQGAVEKRFTYAGAPVTAAPTATEAPTATATAIPTEAPTPTATVAPTDTPVPTTAAQAEKLTLALTPSVDENGDILELGDYLELNVLGIPERTEKIKFTVTLNGASTSPRTGTKCRIPTSALQVGENTIEVSYEDGGKTVSESVKFNVYLIVDGGPFTAGTKAITGTAKGTELLLYVNGVVKASARTNSSTGSFKFITAPCKEGDVLRIVIAADINEKPAAWTGTIAQDAAATAEATETPTEAPTEAPARAALTMRLNPAANEAGYLSKPAEGKLTVTIKGEDGERFVLLLDGKERYRATLQNGAYTASISVDDLSDGEHTLQLSYADDTTNVVTRTFNYKATMADITVTEAVYSGEYVLQGTADPGASLELQINGSQSGTTKADATTGAFTFPAQTFAAGDSLRITATDAAGNVRRWTGTVGTKTRRAITLQFAEYSDRGWDGAGETYTAYGQMESVTLTGQAEPNAALTITVENRSAMVTADANGQWRMEYDVSDLKDGSTSTIVANYAEPQEDDPPQPKALTLKVDRSVSGLTLTDTVNEESTTLRGTTEANASVLLKQGDTVLAAAQADAAGMFTLQFDSVAAGTILTLKVTDIYQNTLTQQITVEAVTLKPIEIHVEVPPKGCIHDSDSQHFTYAGWKESVTFYGTCSPNRTMEIKRNGEDYGSIQSGFDGNWTFTIRVRANEEDAYHLVDVSGKVTSETIYVLSDAETAAPVCNEVSSGDTTITGTCEGDSTVEVFAGGTSLGSAEAGSNGSFTVQLNRAVQSGDTLTVRVTDWAENANETTLTVTQNLPIACGAIKYPADNYNCETEKLGIDARMLCGDGVSGYVRVKETNSMLFRLSAAPENRVESIKNEFAGQAQAQQQLYWKGNVLLADYGMDKGAYTLELVAALPDGSETVLDTKRFTVNSESGEEEQGKEQWISTEYNFAVGIDAPTYTYKANTAPLLSAYFYAPEGAEVDFSLVNEDAPDKVTLERNQPKRQARSLMRGLESDLDTSDLDLSKAGVVIKLKKLGEGTYVFTPTVSVKLDGANNTQSYTLAPITVTVSKDGTNVTQKMITENWQ